MYVAEPGFGLIAEPNGGGVVDTGGALVEPPPETALDPGWDPTITDILGPDDTVLFPGDVPVTVTPTGGEVYDLPVDDVMLDVEPATAEAGTGLPGWGWLALAGVALLAVPSGHRRRRRR